MNATALDIFVAEKSLLQAVRDQLRLIAGYTEHECEIELDDMVPATVGHKYILVAAAGWMPGPRHNTSGGVNDLLFNVDVAVIKRITNVPRDRRRNMFFDRLSSLNEEIANVFSAVDWNYDTMNAATAVMQAEASGAEPFIEPLRFTGADTRPKLAPAELFGGSGDNAAGIMRTISFGKCRRITTKS